MKKILKNIWKHWEKISDEWYNFLEKIILWTILFIATDYEVYYAKNDISGFIYIKITFIAITLFSSILLILYIFKKCYFITNELLPHGKSKLLWTLTLIEALVLCYMCVLIAAMIGFILKSIPGL